MSSKSARGTKRRKQLIRRRVAIGAVAAAGVTGGVIALTRGGNGGRTAGIAAADEDITPSARGFLEPPYLASRIESGKLPAIDDRIPEEPFQVGPGVLLEEEHLTWEDGRYGGDIAVSSLGASGFVNIVSTTILRSPGQRTDVGTPNVVTSFEYDEAFTTFTFTLRRGLKWSDGEPVTTEDVRFAMEDIYDNPEAGRPAPSWLFTQGDPAKGLAQLDVVDEQVFTLTFSEPYGQFVAGLNSWIPSYAELIKPAHYLKQFHADHADKDELDELIEENGRNDWQSLLEYKDVSHWDVGEPRALGMPTLNAWVLKESAENLTVFERNPYFWHVDATGHQLPYIDTVTVNRVVDNAASTNAILAGQVTLASGGDVSLSEMPVYTQNAERSGFRVFTTGSFNNPLQLFLNRDFEWTENGSQWQVLMSDPDLRFHKAISAAIDSDAINEAVYFGLFEKRATEWGAFDPDAAAAMLDELGMETGGDGRRTYPDGSPFTLTVTYEDVQSDMTPVAELVRSALADVNINVKLEAIDSTLWGQRKDSNQVMASLHWNDGQGWAAGISEDYLPNHKGPWATEQWLYFVNNGEIGRELTPELKEFLALHTSRSEVPPGSPDGQQRWEALATWLRENYAFIPLTGAKVTPTVADVGLRNLPNEGAPVELDVYINAPGVWMDE